tara:strand:+ start:3812 stop:4099 length:288 start_codon:yes stop_codon:yes gene_type:complete
MLYSIQRVVSQDDERFTVEGLPGLSEVPHDQVEDVVQTLRAAGEAVQAVLIVERDEDWFEEVAERRVWPAALFLFVSAASAASWWWYTTQYLPAG